LRNFELHRELEERLAKFKDVKAVLFLEADMPQI